MAKSYSDDLKLRIIEYLYEGNAYKLFKISNL